MNNNWTVHYKGFDKTSHPLQEALCTLGNGYFATRAALEMEPNQWETKEQGVKPGKSWNYPGTYLAGGYNRMKSKVQDKTIENEDLVNWPDWLPLTWKIEGGDWLDMDQVEILEFETRLNMDQGILERHMTFRDKQGHETLLKSRRLVSMDNPHAAAIQWMFTPLNWSAGVTFRSAIDGHIINNNVKRYSDLNQNHVQVLQTGNFDTNGIFLVSRSLQSSILVAQAAATHFYIDEERKEIKQNPVINENYTGGDYALNCRKGQTVRVEKIASFYSSRDMAIADPLTEARNLVQRNTLFCDLEKKHQTQWEQIWQYNDIELNTSDKLDQLVTRLHIFHVYQTVSYNSIDLDIGIPARGWHGEAYRGHIFWDELYIQPYIDLIYPQLSRSLLMYRYRRLPEARIAAKNAGYNGAMFPWQSGSNGREETQKIHLNPRSGRWLPDVSHLQYHINAAVPFNVWHYYQSSGDMDFLLSHGAEIILSTALFWSSKATFNKQKNRYEILSAMGPDEYHTHYPDAKPEDPGLHNNAYTNIMAVWVIEHALQLLDLLDANCCENLKKSIGINDRELERWKDITQRMFVPFEGKIIMQFEGYEKLRELDWKHYHQKHGKALRLDRILEAEDDSCNKYKASKQADVLMLFYLFSREELTGIFDKLGYDFKPEHIPENIEYYRKRTAHGSTLSQVIHAWVYARSHRDESWKRFREALMSDFKDVQGGTTHEGIHLGAMAGTLDLIKRCYSGLEIRDDILWFNPRLPEDISSMSFYIRYRSHWMKLHMNHKKLTISFDKGWANPVTIAVRGQTHRFESKDKKEFNL